MRLMAGLVFLLVMAFLAGLAPPPSWGVRLAAVIGIVIAIGAYVLPMVYNASGLYLLSLIFLLWLAAACLAGIGLRWFADIGLRRLITGTWRVSSPLEVAGTRVLDAGLRFGVGVYLGCVLFEALAVVFGGSGRGLPLHLAVAAAAGLGAAAAWRTRARAVVLGTAATVAALALDGGFRYPDLILRAAEAAGPNVPRCLMIGPDLAPPRDRADLMALTIPKDFRGPSDVLLLRQSGTHTELFRWSFRARRFVEAPTYIYAPPLCTPTLAPLLPGCAPVAPRPGICHNRPTAPREA